MFGKGKKQKPQAVKSKNRFEQPHDSHQSEWRKPQGIYLDDIDAKKRLSLWLGRFLISSQVVSLLLMTLLFIGMTFMLAFGNYENVIFDDGSRLFCTLLEDDSVGIAY